MHAALHECTQHLAGFRAYALGLGRSGRFGPRPAKLPERPSCPPSRRWRATTGHRVGPSAVALRARPFWRPLRNGGRRFNSHVKTAGSVLWTAPGPDRPCGIGNFWGRRTTAAGLTVNAAGHRRPGRAASAERREERVGLSSPDHCRRSYVACTGPPDHRVPIPPHSVNITDPVAQFQWNFATPLLESRRQPRSGLREKSGLVLCQSLFLGFTTAILAKKCA